MKCLVVTVVFFSFYISAQLLESKTCEIVRLTTEQNSVAILLLKNKFPLKFSNKIISCISRSSSVIVIEGTRKVIPNLSSIKSDTVIVIGGVVNKVSFINFDIC